MPRIKKFNPRQKHKHSDLSIKNVSVNTVPPPNLNNENHDENNASCRSSSSKKKLSYLENESYSDNNTSSGSLIIDLDIISQLIESNVACKYCKNVNSVKLVEDISCRRGLATKIILECSICKVKNSVMSSSVNRNRIYNVNIRLSYAMRCIGKGQRSAKTFCGIMDLPPPSTKFMKSNSIILNSLKEVAEGCMLNAAKEAKMINNNSGDIVAACDASWQKRGHTSLNGVVTITSADTGKVLDAECLTKHCHGCISGKGRHKCMKNYTGASGGMEAEGAVKMFERSVWHRGLRYVKYLGDGDSKGFLKVQDSKPYGNNVLIEKLECVGHVQKRLGTRLRKLRKDLGVKKLSDNKPIKGRGRLTDAEIDKLQHYFGLAIRRNTGNLKAMKKAIWATFLHKMSTDAEPKHHLCPLGMESWCGFRRQEAGGPKYTHKNSLPEAVLEAIEPVYKGLTDDSLLRKCLHGGTQNVNESFNRSIWQRIPKTEFVGMRSLQIGVYDAIICFNGGAMSRKGVLENMGLKPGANMVKAMLQIDHERVATSEKAILQSSMEARIMKRNRKRKREDKEMEEQDDYGPGMF